MYPLSRYLSKMSDIIDSSSSSSFGLLDSNEDLVQELAEGILKPKNENFLEETVPQFSHIVFQEHFRINRYIAQSLAEEFTQSQYYNDTNGPFAKIESYHQILIFLWYAGHQTASFRDVGDRFNIAISTLHKIIKKVTCFLSSLSPNVIKWPNREEKISIIQHFRLHGFPEVIGVIDGTHIKIDKPSDDPDSYLNRKHFYSVHMQAVCDHNRKFTHVFIGYPGSVHDSRVFRTSPLANSLEEKCEDTLIILGDSGYPCLKNLVTPFRDRGQLTRRQINYNTKLATNRYIIEHTFGILKQKWRQLYHLKLRSIELITHFIRACCVLHNLAIAEAFEVDELRNAIEEENGGEHVNNNEEGEGEADDQTGIGVRNRIVNMLAL